MKLGLLTWRATSQDALRRLAAGADLAAGVDSGAAGEAGAAGTAGPVDTGTRVGRHRLALVVRDGEDPRPLWASALDKLARSGLRGLRLPVGIYYASGAADEPGATAFLFPGQGSLHRWRRWPRVTWTSPSRPNPLHPSPRRSASSTATWP